MVFYYLKVVSSIKNMFLCWLPFFFSTNINAQIIIIGSSTTLYR